MPLTVGTAGHIDHGKTWLVRALTGKDTDRLPEEKERGISIDLGYAPLELQDGRRLSLIDVPGHERFIRNMVAGASGIDLFLLVIDATEGAKPQTHEHLAILRLLGIEDGVVAVTKADAADPDLLEAVLDEARELVPEAQVVAVSAKTGEGLDELRMALAAVAERKEHTTPLAATRYYVDRVFSLHGIGTVVTGTLWSGSVAESDELRAEPAGADVRVRSVQVHDEPVERAEAGQRVALAIPGVERHVLNRGDALIEPGAYPLSYRLDVELTELEPIGDHARVSVHHGTTETPARLVRVGDRFAQLRLADPVVAARGDRVVLRDRTTLGGGRILDPAPPRAPDAERLELLATDDAVSIVKALVHEPVRANELAARALLSPGQLEQGLATMVRAGEWYFAPDWLEKIGREARTRLVLRAEATPLDPGLSAGELLPGSAVGGRGAPAARRRAPQRKGLPAGLCGRPRRTRGRSRGARGEGARDGPHAGAGRRRRAARFLEESGRLVRVGDGLAIGPDAYEEAKRAVIEECERQGKITLARFRDLLGISRKPAQLLLERFDADGLTQGLGDERVLRRKATIDR